MRRYSYIDGSRNDLLPFNEIEARFEPGTQLYIEMETYDGGETPLQQTEISLPKYAAEELRNLLNEYLKS